MANERLYIKYGYDDPEKAPIIAVISQEEVEYESSTFEKLIDEEDQEFEELGVWYEYEVGEGNKLVNRRLYRTQAV